MTRGRHEGSLYKREEDGLWVGSVSLGYDAEGKRIRKNVYGKTKKEAREKMLKLQQDSLNGIPIKNKNLTIDHHFQDWLKTKKSTVRETTLRSYNDIYRKHIMPYLGHVQIKSLDYRRINALYDFLDNEGLSRRTVSYVCFILRSGLEDAVKKGIISTNQAKLAAGRTQGKKEARYLDQTEIKDFLEALKEERLEYGFILALHTGLRPGEWMGLPWDAIDWEKKRLTVKQALHEDSGRVWIDNIKTDAGRRTISLSETTISCLKKQKKRQLEEQLASSKNWLNEKNLVFTNTIGKPLRRTHVGRRDLKRITDRAGLKGVTLHTLRHTHTSILIFQDVDVKTISKRLGHEDVAFTLQTYGHLFPGKDEKAATQMDAFSKNL